MKKNFLAITLLLAGLACPSSLVAQDALLGLRPVSCNAATLKGYYAVSITGTRPAPFVLPAFNGVPAGTIETVIGNFILIFDGNGGIRMGENPTVKGSLSGLFPTKAGDGTYKMNADCSGTFSINLPQLPGPLVNNMVVMNGGSEFRSVVVAPQALMISVTAGQIQ